MFAEPGLGSDVSLLAKGPKHTSCNNLAAFLLTRVDALKTNGASMVSVLDLQKHVLNFKSLALQVGQSAHGFEMRGVGATVEAAQTSQNNHAILFVM